MTLVHPFQPRVSCDSVVSMVLLVLMMFKVLLNDPVLGTRVLSSAENTSGFTSSTSKTL